MSTAPDLFTPEQTMSTALVEHAPATPMELFATLDLNLVDTDKVRALVDMQREWRRDLAAEAFGEAITKFQAECPRIEKCRTATVQSKREGASGYKYQFAGYDDVMKQAAPILKACGLAVTYSTEQVDGQLKITCRIRHGIHFEDHSLTVPIPAMTVNDTQRYGAALSYAKRYAFCAALNIIVSDDVDDDAAGMVERITEEQLVTLNEWIESTNTDLKRFLHWLALDKLTDMSADQFSVALTELKRKAAKR